VRRMLTIAAAGALLLTGCRAGGEDQGETTEATVAARTAVAATRDLPLVVTGIGSVAPRPGRYAALGAPAATRVARIFVLAGQRVRSGDPLVEFERAPFEAAARSAESELTAAQHAYDRAVRLGEAGVVARRDVEQAAEVLAQAQVAQVTAQRDLELATLRAPLAGVVTTMSAVVGAPVDAAQPLVEVADPSALDVVVGLVPADAAGVRRGLAATFTAGEAPAAAVVAEGVVGEVAPAVDTATRAVPVRVRVTRQARPLRIGETLFARVVVDTHRGAVTVPDEALVPDGEGFKVFVVDSAGVAHARPVTVGTRAGALAEILDGVRAGERVVTYGAYGMDEGAKVVTGTP
jgi:membrane fusion protein (multidrug efflux system)